MTSVNYEKQNLHLTEYFNKSTELKVIKLILSTKNNALRTKEKILKETYKELNEINYNVWIIEDKFCNEIWNFSLLHNFSSLFNRYPDVTEVNELHKCKYNSVIDKDAEKTDTCKENIPFKLKHEIDILNNEIMLIRNKNIEKDLNHCKSTLDNLKLFSEEITEVIRLISTSENSMNICNTIINRKPITCIPEGFTSAKKLFKIPAFRNNVLTETKNISTSSRIIEQLTERHKMNNNINIGKFTVRKRSLISLKFEKKIKELKI